MGRVHNKHSFSEQEIRALLIYAYTTGLIGKTTGIIKKETLRNILRTKLQSHELHILDVDRLGHVLHEHGYLLNAPREDRNYKFDTKTLDQMVKTALKKTQEKKELIQNSTDPAKFEYKITIKRPKKYNLARFMAMKVPVCSVCNKALFVDDKEHIRTVHGDDFDFPENELHAKTHQIFQLDYTLDANYLTVKVKNIQSNGLTVNHIQLIHDYDQICVLEYDWPYTMSLEETIEIPVNRHYFDIIDYKYSFIIHSERVKEYVEQHHLVIKNPLPEISNVKKEIIRKNPSLISQSIHPLRAKRKDLPVHFPDTSILKLFTDDFQLKEGDPEMLKSKALKMLIDFKRSNYEVQSKNYIPIFKLLNQIEDLFIMKEFEKYRLLNRNIVKKYRNLAIDVSDVMDLPMLESGDIMMLRDMSTVSVISPYFIECTVLKVLDNHIFFKSSQKLPSYTSLKPFEAKFRKDRTVIRMGQQALDTLEVELLVKTFFPENCGTKSKEYVCYEWLSDGIKSNNEQQQAVRNIVNGSAYPAPYIVFGPPGTGKTSTLVEAIAQIWKQNLKMHILVTASSNYACDEIAGRLLKYIPPDDMYRYYSRSYVKRLDDIDDELICISNLNKGFHEHPDIRELYNYRVVITTLINAGRLALNQMKKNFFDYIFIDEAGSATEPSAIIPLSGLISLEQPGRSNIVIAGDPKQLGPIIHCKYAEVFGLGRSLLERLMSTKLYQPDPITKLYNEAVITKLLNNYRSHGDILWSANQLFYDGELIPKAGTHITDIALNWSFLPNRKVPLIFHSVEGFTRHQENSHSLYNEKEVSYVIAYIREIIKNGIKGRGIKQSEIGIISPYRKQCDDIKDKLRKFGWKEIEVGSVEQFQGQEKTVIILSTVRSKTHTVGFLDNPKRLNVSITRAKALMIVIANPETLQLDANWYELIKYCKEKGACAGGDFELRKPTAKLIDASGNELQSFEEKLSETVDVLIHKFEQLQTI